ncbi:TatD family hydrolase [Spirochaetota bacterium]
MIVDTHAHLTLKRLRGETDEVIQEAHQHGVSHIIDIGVTARDIHRRRKVLSGYENIFFSAAVCPHEAANCTDEDIKELEDTIKSSDIIAVGETGLEYHHFSDKAHRVKQAELLDVHIALAKQYGKPVILHIRDAYDEIIPIMQKEKDVQYINHCFTGNTGNAKKLLDLGAYISFAGNLTYKNAADLHGACTFVPLDRLLFETDTPYLSPAPVRGEKNRPAYIEHTINFASSLRKENQEDLIEKVFQNSCAVFNIPRG